MNDKLEAAFSPQMLEMLAMAVAQSTGIPVEYLAVTIKLQDREPWSKTHRGRLYDRHLPRKYGREKDDGAAEEGVGAADHRDGGVDHVRGDAGDHVRGPAAG